MGILKWWSHRIDSSCCFSRKAKALEKLHSEWQKKIMGTLIKNAQIVNEGIIFKGHLLIEGERISKIFQEGDDIS